MRTESPAFHAHAAMPRRFTCAEADASDISPPLSLRLDGESARSLALVVEDTDGAAGPWVHRIVHDLTPSRPFVAAALLVGTDASAQPPPRQEAMRV